MTPADNPFTTPDDTDARRRSMLGAATALAAAVLALSACGVGGEPVDASTAPSSVAPVTDVETTDCPAWANEVLASSPTDSSIDAEGWREHFLDRSVLLAAAAEQLPAADAAVIDDYADAVRDFGTDPMSPGASRQMGEAAADAAAVATRSC